MAGQSSFNETVLNFMEAPNSKEGCFDDYMLTSEACALMKQKLPSYVVNSFIATGYDTLDVIAEINDEALAEIEEIMNNEYLGDACFRNQSIHINTSASVFKFQPGHLKRIKKFVEEVQELLSAKQTSMCTKRKRHVSTFKANVKLARMSDEKGVDEFEDEDCSTELDLLANFRQSFAKWQRHQKQSELRDIKENKHFLVRISVSNSKINASVNCYLCGNVLSLGVKSNKVLLSNWTRHLMQSCKHKQKSISNSLEKYFTISSTMKSINQSFSAISPSLENTAVKTAPVTKGKCKYSVIISNICIIHSYNY